MIRSLRRVDGELWTVAGSVALVGVGWGINSTPLAVIAVLAALTAGSLYIWQRDCLNGVSYQRALGASCALFGETISLEIAITNDKLLPLTWLLAEDEVPAALEIIGGSISRDGTYSNALVTFVPMLPYQRARRSLTVRCSRRGVYTFGPARLTSGDPVGIRKRSIPVAERVDLLVYPKVFTIAPQGVPSQVFIGDERSGVRLFEDPSRIAGRREYRTGDSLRDIDWRATARSTTLLVREFEPTVALRVAVLLDVQVPPLGTESWSHDLPELEFAIAVTASFVAEYSNRGIATGLYSSGTVEGRPIAFPPSSAPTAQLKMFEGLARISPSEIFAFSEVLSGAQRGFRQGTTVVIISANFSEPTMLSIAEIGAIIASLQCGLRRRVARRRRPDLSMSFSKRVTAMTGHNERSWNWLYSVVLPIVLAAVEAIWVSTWFGALARTAPGAAPGIPYPVVALPEVFAALVAGSIADRKWSAWTRVAVTVPAAILGAALTAGFIGAFVLHGGFGSISTHPWSLKGSTPIAQATIAWMIAGFTWTRGTWLGRSEPSVVRSMDTVLACAMALTAFFVVAATTKQPAFEKLVRGTELLLLIGFPGAVSAIALANERRLEHETVGTSRARPTMTRLGIIAVPMMVVAGAASLITFVARPLSPIVAREVQRLAREIVRLTSIASQWLAHFVHLAPHETAVHRQALPKVGKSNGGAAHWVIAVVLIVLVVVLVSYLFRFVRRHLRFRLARWRSRDDEEKARETVFSWSHLLENLSRMVRRRTGALRVRRRPSINGSLDQSPSDELPSVRRAYRRVLVAARSIGQGRASSETAQEFRDRILPSSSGEVRLALAEITALYERARYGDVADRADDLALAASQADLLIATLTAPAAGVEADEQ